MDTACVHHGPAYVRHTETSSANIYVLQDIVRPQWREGGLDPKGGFRGLQQAEELTVVNSAEALKVAIETGAAHIEIQDHLNLTELSLIESKTNFGDVWKTLLGPVPASVQSIRVR